MTTKKSSSSLEAGDLRPSESPIPTCQPQWEAHTAAALPPDNLSSWQRVAQKGVPRRLAGQRGEEMNEQLWLSAPSLQYLLVYLLKVATSQGLPQDPTGPMACTWMMV